MAPSNTIKKIVHYCCWLGSGPPQYMQLLQDQLTTWRAKAQSNAREWEDRNESLYNEKVAMGHHYQQLKASMDAFRASISERLKQLSQAAAMCTKTLETRLAKAETILKLAERCRKLETEQVGSRM
jgi:dynein regulatory complex subunit 2